MVHSVLSEGLSQSQQILGIGIVSNGRQRGAVCGRTEIAGFLVRRGTHDRCISLHAQRGESLHRLQTRSHCDSRLHERGIAGDQICGPVGARDVVHIVNTVDIFVNHGAILVTAVGLPIIPIFNALTVAAVTWISRIPFINSLRVRR